ncbi:hypothetical protein MGN70_012156 [Eutypa lata]|uniref:Putative conidiation-specific protein 10 protein n=1 Tax=Eutypa lata (strain UCR-EL1) TaxID=1287681 RepID=M7T824_EUTLA|nr:putative conidiation-specific protein 10 protein [Eutypa lata UCREL1]KAI1245266.1 hypothetical protein MGN70_012156 [Eutypa lata]
MPTNSNNPGNFANRPKEEVQEIASKGGHASGGGGQTEAPQASANDSTETSQAGGGNPGNFANRPKEEVQAIASKGGQASSGSFEPGSEKASEAGRKGGSK